MSRLDTSQIERGTLDSRRQSGSQSRTCLLTRRKLGHEALANLLNLATESTLNGELEVGNVPDCFDVVRVRLDLETCVP